MLIELIRHGETALQQEHRYQGSTDAPLSSVGRAALHAAGYVPEVLVVTGLKRTVETAEILFPGVPQRIAPELREMDFGVFEGRNYLEMEHDQAYRNWVDGMCLGKCPGGESKAEFCSRVCDAFLQLLKNVRCDVVEDGKIAIVAHGGTQMAILERFAVPRKDYYSWHYSSGQGVLLAETMENGQLSLSVLKTTDYTKG